MRPLFEAISYEYLKLHCFNIHFENLTESS